MTTKLRKPSFFDIQEDTSFELIKPSVSSKHEIFKDVPAEKRTWSKFYLGKTVKPAHRINIGTKFVWSNCVIKFPSTVGPLYDFYCSIIFEDRLYRGVKTLEAHSVNKYFSVYECSVERVEPFYAIIGKVSPFLVGYE